MIKPILKEMIKPIIAPIFVGQASDTADAWNGYLLTNPPTTVSSGMKWVDIDPSLIQISSYGVAWNEETGTYERLGDLALYPTSMSPGNALLPIHAQMKRCVVNDTGVVQYFLDSHNSTKKADGTAANLTGADGQVMTYIQKLYSRYDYNAGRHEWEISTVPKAGFTVDPAFIKGGIEVPYRLVGAYEGYIDGAGKLCSISGVLPSTYKTRAQFRAAAALRGAGWHQYDAALAGLLQRLFLIEYADFDSQSMIGAGVTEYATWPSGPQALSGNSDAAGAMTSNVSGVVPKWIAATAKSIGSEVIPNATQTGYTYRCTTAGTTGGAEPTWPTTIGGTVVDGAATWECVRTNKYMSYRGVENWFGHIFKFVDGINIHNSVADRSRVYVCGDPANFADDTATGYGLIGLAAEADGYGQKIIPILGVISPRTVGATSATGLCGYYYTYFDNDLNSGWRVCLLGGVAHGGVFAGAFNWLSNNASSYAHSSFGGRLCF